MMTTTFSSDLTVSPNMLLRKPTLKHIIQLGAKGPALSLGLNTWPNDKCLILFPNYITGNWIGAECTLEVRTQVEFFLKRAHAERASKKPPQQSLTEQTAAELLQISVSTLRSWARKGLLYQWMDFRPGRWWAYSNAEVQALMLAKCRLM